jgi:hypothetical protein
MGHFAQIEDGIVTQVIVVNNDVLGEPTFSFPDTEGAGRAFIANTLGLPGEWRQTSYSDSFRGKYAGVGDRFDSELDVFVSPVIGVVDE